MTRWIGIVLALSDSADEGMASSLVTCLHPVAGRPLVWHSVASLAALDAPPERILVIAGVDLAPGLFQDLPVPVEVLLRPGADLGHVEVHLPADPDLAALVVDAAVLASPDDLRALGDAPAGHWLSAAGSRAAAARLSAAQLSQLFRLPQPLQTPNGVLADGHRLEAAAGAPTILVRDRHSLARVTQLVRDRLVRALMEGGVTFLLPESVVVDVDVRIGRDSVVYPGAVLEGQTTIGEETVIGPGCRVIDSWVGSGVEMRGWNYISHTSIRNRAILEPYVRRGFD